MFPAGPYRTLGPTGSGIRLARRLFFPNLKMTNPKSDNAMMIHLTPEQERRIRAVLRRGAYQSVEEVVEAALTAVEQWTVLGFAGTPGKLDILLTEGEFWSSVSEQTDALLAEYKTGPHS